MTAANEKVPRGPTIEPGPILPAVPEVGRKEDEWLAEVGHELRGHWLPSAMLLLGAPPAR